VGGVGRPEVKEEALRAVLRRNFWTFSLCELVWGLGWGASDSSTIMTVFLHKLGLPKTVIGLVPALLVLGFALPELPIAYLTERLPLKRRVYLWLHLPAVLSWLAISWLALLMRNPPSPLLFALFLFFYAVYALSIGAVIPLWYALIAKLIPQGMRGRLFGLVNLFSAVGAAGGATLAGAVLRALPFPRGYATCFGLTFVFFLVGTATLLLIVEPIPSPATPKVSVGEYLRRLKRMLTLDREFSLYLAARAVGALAGMASPFLAVYGVEKFNAPSGTAANFALVLLVAHSAASPLWGLWGERRGFRWVAIVGGWIGVLSLVVALLSPSLGVYYLAFLLNGAAMASGFIAHSNLVLDFCPYEEKATFVGLAGTITAPFMAVAPVAGGKLIDLISYTPTFIISSAMGLLGVYMLWLLPEPRASRRAFEGDVALRGRGR